MPTKKPLSTVSFNTEPFLRSVLSRFPGAFWFYIRHEPEQRTILQEKKPHYHVYIDFNGASVDPAVIRDYFVEKVEGEDKPRKCLPLKASKFEDAYLYFLHDETYLTAKNETRDFHYLTSDIVTNSQDDLIELVNMIDYRKYQRADYLSIMEQAYNRGVRSFGTLITFYRPPLNQYQSWARCWFDYCQYREQLERDPSMRTECAWHDFATERKHMRLTADMGQ